MLTYEQAHALLIYDPETGLFRWRVNRHKHRAGTIAGCLNEDGYRKIQTGGKTYTASHLATLMMTGTWPVAEVDHEDLDKCNDRWSNLRPATRSQNTANVAVRKNSATGLKGAWRTKSGRFEACIFKDRVRRHLGTFDTALEAHQAYLAAAKVHHGPFARAT